MSQNRTPARERRAGGRRVATVLGAAALCLAALAACSSDPEPASSPKVPKGFEVPSGVTLTDAGSTIAVGKAATVVYDPGGAATAVSVRVDKIAKGSIKDFRFFSLDEASKKATPYYVRLTATNRGPAGLGGSSLPVYAHTASNTLFPPNELVGTFKPCPDARLPKSFLAGSTAKICLIYLLPPGEKLDTIDIQPGAEKDAIHVEP